MKCIFAAVLLQFWFCAAVHLSGTARTLHHTVTQPIPKILHRVFLAQKNGEAVCKGMNGKRMGECRTETIKNNPGWQEWVWGEQEIEALFKANAKFFADKSTNDDGYSRDIGEFPAVYHNFDGWMKKQDSIRHLILYMYGGLYMDFDMSCKPFGGLLDNANMVLRFLGKTNFLASAPRQQFSLEVLKGIILTAKTGIPAGQHVKADVSKEPDGSMNPIMATGEQQIRNVMYQMGYGLEKTGDLTGTYPSGIPMPGEIRVLPDDAVANFLADGTYVQGHYSVGGEPVCIHNPLNAWAQERYNHVKAVKTTLKQRLDNLHKGCPTIYSNAVYGEELMKKANLIGV